MDSQLVFKVKEEILGTVIKKHNHILITGWNKTGKTTSVLKTTRHFNNRVYYSPDKRSLSYALEVDKDIKTITSISEIPTTSDVLLIVDDFSRVDNETQKTIWGFIRNNKSMKIVVVSNKIIDLKPVLLIFDAVVRFKNDTAEILYSSLLEESLSEGKT
ncbi:MAG: hypothetical protein N3A62_01385 [Thermodesulfovibrionales bacterium]|nr:hypothetical protein [Thermodesulfovibrionales bacterium]